MANENVYINQLTEATTASDSDQVIIEGQETKRISFSNLCNAIKEKLGIDNILSSRDNATKPTEQMWYIGFMAYGLGLAIIMNTNKALQVNSVQVFDDSGAWKNFRLTGKYDVGGNIFVTAENNNNASVVDGKVYLVSINFSIQ